MSCLAFVQHLPCWGCLPSQEHSGRQHLRVQSRDLHMPCSLPRRRIRHVLTRATTVVFRPWRARLLCRSHGRHSGVLCGRKVDEKERQEATFLPAPPFFKTFVPNSHIFESSLPRASAFPLVKKAGMPAGMRARAHHANDSCAGAPIRTIPRR